MMCITYHFMCLSPVAHYYFMYKMVAWNPFHILSWLRALALSLFHALGCLSFYVSFLYRFFKTLNPKAALPTEVRDDDRSVVAYSWHMHARTRRQDEITRARMLPFLLFHTRVVGHQLRRIHVITRSNDSSGLLDPACSRTKPRHHSDLLPLWRIIGQLHTSRQTLTFNFSQENIRYII
jgi:hypothetical protein